MVSCNTLDQCMVIMQFNAAASINTRTRGNSTWLDVSEKQEHVAFAGF